MIPEKYKMDAEQQAVTNWASSPRTTRAPSRCWRTLGAALCLTAALSACTQAPVSTRGDADISPRSAASQPKVADSIDRAAPGADRETAESAVRAKTPYVSIGTGEFVKEPRRRIPPPADTGAPVSLNLENGDVRELVKNVIVDTLQENVIIDPRVTGVVTIRTPKPLPRSELLPVLDTLLRSVGFALVKDGNLWRVLPQAEAIQGTATPRPNVRNLGPGVGVVILPVKYVGAKELQRLMQPFARQPESAIRVDEVRNLLFLFGTETELKHLVEIADMFDVDLLSGMSFVIYPLQSAEVKSVVADWERIFPAAANPVAGLVRLIPIERMNALLVISPNPEVVKEAQRLLERLDSGNDAGGGARLHVYQVKFTQADKLQAVLQQAMSGRATPAATVAPGQQVSSLSAPIAPVAGQAGLVVPGNTAGTQTAVQNQVARTVPTGVPGGQGASALARNATIIADKDRNALLIVATPSEYSAIEAALLKLDVPPKQVAIEVQIAEVSLSGDFQFGLQSYFQGKLEGIQNRLTSADGVGSIASGAFTYTWKKTDAIQAILNLSEQKNKIRTLAQPTLITLENQKATFSAGTQISVRTQSSASTGTVTTTDSYQYINTGINVTVTPRVSGNNVFLEIQQEISDAGVAAEGNPNPPITKRSASTNVMVVSGDTMLMGGLFQEGGRTASSGLPLVSGIPVVGGLFGSQRWQSDRTELVLLITPRVLQSVEDTRGVIDELRGRLKGIESLIPAVGVKDMPASGELRRERTKAALGEYSHSLRLPSDEATK